MLPPCVYGLTIFFSNLSLCGVKQYRRGHMPVNSYDGRKVSLQWPQGNGDLDIGRASYARRKANITEAISEPCILRINFTKEL